MKRFIVAVLEIIVCFLLQTVIFPNLSIANIIPNILLILVVSTAYMYGKVYGLYIGLVCGLLFDITNGNLLGIYGLVYMVIGYLNGIAVKIYYKDDFTMPVLLIGVSDFVAGFMFFVFEFLLRNRLNLIFYMKRIIIPEVLYTVVVSIFLYKILNTLNGKLSKWFYKEV